MRARRRARTKAGLAFRLTSRLGDVCCSALADWRKFCRRKTTAKSKCAVGQGPQAAAPSCCWAMGLAPASGLSHCAPSTHNNR